MCSLQVEHVLCAVLCCAVDHALQANLLATCGADATVQLFDLGNQRQLTTLTGTAGALGWLCVEMDGTWLHTGTLLALKPEVYLCWAVTLVEVVVRRTCSSRHLSTDSVSGLQQHMHTCTRLQSATCSCRWY